MAEEKSTLQQRIESARPILLAEVSPPRGTDPAPLEEAARRYAGKVHALGISDNRDRVCMSALAAASLVAAEGVEPILHVVTRDRNRIALISDFLGAQALGIRNVLCTTGTHQTLGCFRSARNVFDVDSIQLLRAYRDLAGDASLVGEDAIEAAAAAPCLGAAASPFADPVELQVMRLAKKVAAGAQFVITQPVFDVERFEAWWKEVTARGIQERVAILAGIQPLTDAEEGTALARRRPSPVVPEAMLRRIASAGDAAAERGVGIAVAVEIIERLSGLEGLRGFEICGDGDDEAALEVIEKAGLATD